MTNHLKTVLGSLALGIGLTFAAPQAQAVIVVNGNLSDWGISPGAYISGPANDVQWTPTVANIQYAKEDQPPTVDFLNPGYGGQKFDVEWIGFTADSTYAYFAVVTGFPLENPPSGYFPGDFALDFNADGTYEFGIETVGVHYLVKNPLWDAATFPVSSPYGIKSGTGTNVGVVQFGYDKTSYIANGHYAFEMGIPLSWFSLYMDGVNDPNFKAHWTMNCGNDALDLYAKPIPPPPVPEPASMVLMGMGLVSAGLVRRRKKV